ncbi:MAG: ABC transporter ATP-binding protein [Bdellovibrionales bacterium]|nr:ABC transporter ATP-binding protein [Bdellovibrionales bacterium]
MLSARGIQKFYPMGSGRLDILKGIDLNVNKGDAVCIVGASGAGKSTLLHIMGTLDKPSMGTVLYRGKDLFRQSDEDLAKFRNSKLGFVFQFHHLMGEFTAIENVMMPARIGGGSKRMARERAEELMATLGMMDRKDHFPSELSGGEQQRVAIARALLNEPEILLADEPTGNLDTKNSHRIQELFFELKQRLELTLVVVTHDQEFASQFPRVHRMKDGLWVKDATALFT